MREHTTPWEAGGVTKDRYVTEGTESAGIFSLGDVYIYPSAGPGPVAIAAGSDIAAQIVKAVNAHDHLVKALEKIIEMNRQHAKDQYGDADKAESWACITVARKALASIEVPA